MPENEERQNTNAMERHGWCWLPCMIDRLAHLCCGFLGLGAISHEAQSILDLAPARDSPYDSQAGII